MKRSRPETVSHTSFDFHKVREKVVWDFFLNGVVLLAKLLLVKFGFLHVSYLLVEDRATFIVSTKKVANLLGVHFRVDRPQILFSK